MKKLLILVLTLTTLFFISCGKAKKNLATSIINSYAQAVKEEDEMTMNEVFPDIKYFEQYPLIDRVEITEMEVDKDNVMALCTLYYTTGLGKNIEQEIKFLVNTQDSTIINVLGYLTRKVRNEFLESGYFTQFPDLKPNENDMDVNYVKNAKIAWNRINGYEYYAKKAIGERTKASLNINYKKRLEYGIIERYSNVTINLKISNNSDFECKYSYKDNSVEYQYTFPSPFKSSDKIYGCEGTFTIKPQETINQSYKFSGSNYMYPLKKEDIEFKLEIGNTDEAIKIVEKYYDEIVKKLILAGEKDFWDDSYHYKIIFE